MNQRNQRNKTPSSGPEMRQLTFLAIILAALLVLVLGGFFVLQMVDSRVNRNDTPAIHDTPGANFSENVTGEQQGTIDEQNGFLESLWAGILNLFSPVENDGSEQNTSKVEKPLPQMGISLQKVMPCASSMSTNTRELG